MKEIVRHKLLNRLIGLRGTPDIKIITGVRRSGKSMLLHSFMNVIQQENPKANIVFIDLTDLDNDHLRDYKNLHAFIKDHYVSDTENILCIDEIQLCDNFEQAINSVHSQGLWDIYLSGSNAFLLSSDLATLFTGRYIEVHVLPFSYIEYRDYFGEEDVDRQLEEYLRVGGMAGSYPYKSDTDRNAYIKSVYETIITRDLVQKYSIANPTALSDLSEYLMDNIGNLCSVNNIAHTLREDKHTSSSSSHVTVGNYLRYLCNSFLFYRVKRYDIHGKKYLNTNDKYYLVDMGFRWALLGMRSMDYGRVYENMVAIELIRRGWDIYIGKLYQKEIDFVAMRGSEKIYIQVSDDISVQDTFMREVDALLKIKDAYPKMLIARTKHETYDYQGIKVHDLARWLADCAQEEKHLVFA